MKNFSVAIDGPAGAGKSTIAKIIAEKLNIIYIDTGAMYRAFTLKLVKNNIDFNDIKTIKNTLRDTTIDFKNNHIFLDGIIVDEEIRTNEISSKVSLVAKIKEVREKLVEIQRDIAKNKSIIMDGRDIGTSVLPNAEFKFFITASVEERASRRYKELIDKGISIDFDKLKNDIIKRDRIDSTRSIAPLKKSEDAIEVDTTNKNINEVIELILDKMKMEGNI
ncbi:cytidylate kinase Cmk [Gottschalkia purinilytica]|uniref:Cytidylate kinase n=1 Tax=Gottschalkia purinilytica TaxID=1503 RepID=A0A0L0W827_GOTPU|nr:(d)CMP kinase [Gottschalkia purinilytica]KNF07445.1 cytidylate kinase Cmk [Gottschalkia purinilytica]